MGGSFIESLVTIWMELGLPWNSYTPMYITALGAVIMFPFFLKNIRISQARNLLKRSNSVYGNERKSMEKTAIDKVQDIPHALLGLADQAIAMKRYDLVAEIIEYLPNTVKMRREIQRLERRMAPRNQFDWNKERLKIENLIEAELWGAAEAHFNALPVDIQRTAEAQCLGQLIKMHVNVESV